MADITATVGTLSFKTPVLTAAGPNVRDHKIINAITATRIGGVVSKTFSTTPADYPKPAIGKTACGGLINCETWSEKGTDEFIDDLLRVERNGVPLIASVGYSIDDMKILGPLVEQRVRPDAIEFSTHYQDQAIEDLVSIASALKDGVSVPVWMKISPNQPRLEEIIRETESIVDAYVAVNSLGPALDFNVEKGAPTLGSTEGYGWLSGPPLLPIALQTVHRIRTVTEKPIVGVGGVSSGTDAIKHLMVGASAVQVCTAAIANGPGVYEQIANEIERWLDDHGYNGIDDVRDRYVDAITERRSAT